MRVLATKVDTLHLGVVCTLPTDALASLERHKVLAQEGGDNLLQWGGVTWRVMPQGAGRFYAYLLKAKDLTLAVSRAATGVCPALRFTFGAALCWDLGLEGVWALAERVARAVAFDRDGLRFVVSRIDLAADLAASGLGSADLREFVTRARRRAGFLERVEGDEPASEYLEGRRKTGWSFGSGAVLCRIYNKTAEARVSGKTEWLEAAWGPLEGEEEEAQDVWRVEVQFRREALREVVAWRAESGEDLDIGTLEGLRGALRALWGYAVGKWISWRRPSRSNRQRTRWETRAEWAELALEDWGAPDAALCLRAVRHAASYGRLVPQAVGLTSTMAALANDSGESLESFLTRLLRDAETYLSRSGKTWSEDVARKRLESAELT